MMTVMLTRSWYEDVQGPLVGLTQWVLATTKRSLPMCNPNDLFASLDPTELGLT